MMLYKFIDSAAIPLVLKSKEIRITTLTHLNDIFDCLPRLTLNGQDMPPYAEAIRKGYGKNFGMICYSRHPESLLLWAHYADMHRGAAIEFCFDTSLDRYEDGSAIPIDYRYDNVRPVLEMEDLKVRPGPQIMLSESKKHIVDAFTVKGRDWFYEQEYRRFINIYGQAERDGHYYELFPPGSFSGVYLGMKCEYKPDDIWKMLGDTTVPVYTAKFAGDGKKNELEFSIHLHLSDVVVGEEAEP